MIFTNSMSLKAYINKIASDKNIPAGQVLQNYLIERFLVRLSKSEYSSNFIVKGGFLIGAMIGIDLRTTMDLDTTVQGFDLTSETLEAIIREVIVIEAVDDFHFSFVDITDIREVDDYPGYRVKLSVEYEKMKEIVKIDVTTGDIITPSKISFEIKQIFDDEVIPLFTYNLETLLAEKLETILSRNVGNTRPRDYYDVYILVKFKEEDMQYDILKTALIETANKRETLHNIENHRQLIDLILQSDIQRDYWEKYRQNYSYAKEIEFDSVIENLRYVMDKIYQD